TQAQAVPPDAVAGDVVASAREATSQALDDPTDADLAELDRRLRRLGDAVATAELRAAAVARKERADALAAEVLARASRRRARSVRRALRRAERSFRAERWDEAAQRFDLA